MKQKNSICDVEMKFPTTIPLLDDMLNGGLKTGSSTLIWCSPFTEGTTLIYQLCASWLSRELPVLYFINTKTPEIVLEDSYQYGWSLSRYREEGLLCFIDSYSSAIGVESKERYVISDPEDQKEIVDVAYNAMRDFRARNCLFVVDSLSTLIDRFGEYVVDLLPELNRSIFLYDLVGVYLFTEWNYDPKLKEKISNICDNLVSIIPVERQVAISDVFTVKRRDGKSVEERIVPFKYIKPGGMRIYIPKILVTGPYNAGKTTVVHALSTRAVSVDRKGTTIALDFGHLEYKGFSADLFGTIGQQRFDPILEQLGGETLGVILVVDSTKPETFSRALEMLRKAKVYGLPLVVFANKQDLPRALPPEEVKERMRLPPEIPVVGTVATEKKNLLNGVETLLSLIFGMGK